MKVIEPTDQAVRGNAYLVHGFSDVHDAGHMRAMTSAFVREGWRVVVWDATYTWSGRSGGDPAGARFYFHHEDLEDVIEWSRGQSWYRHSFMLAGYSLGGVVAGTYAAAHPAQVAGLVLAAPVVSGELLRRRVPAPVRWWWRRRGRLRQKLFGMGLPEWQFMASGWNYDLLKVAERWRQPVIIIAAGRDRLIPPRYIRRLARAGAQGLKVQFISGADHGLNRPEEMRALEECLRNWLSEHSEKNLTKTY